MISTAAWRIVCISSAWGADGGASALSVRPTGPLVSLVSTGRETSNPSARSLEITPAEIIQIASLERVKARPKVCDTVSHCVGQIGRESCRERVCQYV